MKSEIVEAGEESFAPEWSQNSPSLMPELGMHYMERIPPKGLKTNTQKRCVVCKKRGLRKDSRLHCIACPERPGLCRGTDCFGIYHQWKVGQSYDERGSSQLGQHLHNSHLPNSLKPGYPEASFYRSMQHRFHKVRNPQSTYWRNMSEERRALEREKSRLRMQASRARRKELLGDEDVDSIDYLVPSSLAALDFIQTPGDPSEGGGGGDEAPDPSLHTLEKGEGKNHRCMVCQRRHSQYLRDHPRTHPSHNPFKRSKTSFRCRVCKVYLCAQEERQCWWVWHQALTGAAADAAASSSQDPAWTQGLEDDQSLICLDSSG
ncbi:hypothetical protein ACOMHN_063036 [Nucella lapillus]